MALGENIKKRREELKLSQEYVAEQLGVSRQAVSKWETGQSEPTASNLIQLAAVFEMNLSELVAPNKNHKEQSSFEKEPTSTKPNLILRANLIKIAIISQAAFLFTCTSVIYQLRDSDLPNRDLYRGGDFLFPSCCWHLVPFGWQQITATKQIKTSVGKMRILSWDIVVSNY